KLHSSLSVNVRCYLQRYADAKCFSAWVVSFDERSVAVEVPAAEGLDVGEKFLFQISGLEASAKFEAELKEIQGTKLCFRIRSRIQVRPPYENARVRTSLDASVHVGDVTFEVSVADVSAGGMALLSEQPLDRGASVGVSVKTE